MTTYIQVFIYKNGTNPKIRTHLQVFPQKLIQDSEWKNIALYIIKPASSLCSYLTFDMQDEVSSTENALTQQPVSTS